MFLFGGAKSGKSTLTKVMTSQISLMHLVLSSTSAIPLALQHFRRRPFSYDLYQECISAAQILFKFGFNYSVVLIDGLQSWIASLLTLKLNIPIEIDKLCEAICALKGVTIVS
ncbi:MAG: bifunctional adenosylcobinamide kinase/adenosylcobinamide-phosphate guanylyltransferase, partial [Candidatus Hodgkinia cicadicola]